MRRVAKLTAAATAGLLALVQPSATLAAGVIELQGRGVQIYACVATADGFAWRLRAPEATLFDTLGQPSGRHFAGPSWQAKDGSTVTGEVVASGSGDAGTIPWLLLRARAHAGQGLFADVSYIVRSHTSGGVPPAARCGTAQGAQEFRVPYRADYTFFPGPDAGRP